MLVLAKNILHICMSQFAKDIADFMLMIAHGNPYLAVLLMTAVPVVGLNGAIPLGEMLGIAPWQTFWLVVLGRAILCMPLLLFWRQLIAFGKKWRLSRWLFVRLEQVLMSKAEKANASRIMKEKADAQYILQANDFTSTEIIATQNKNEQLRKFWIIISYASLPIPLTGVWTSGAVATMMGTKFGVAVFALLIANIVNCLLIMLLVHLFGKNVDILLLIFMIVALLILIVLLCKIFFDKKIIDT